MRAFRSEWLEWEPGSLGPPDLATDKTDKRASVSFVSMLKVRSGKSGTEDGDADDSSEISVSIFDGKDPGEQSEPLPPEGDPRRAPLEVIDQVWAAGCWLVIDADHVRVVSRGGPALSERLTPDLLTKVDKHQAELLRALTRIPDCREARQSPHG